MAGITPKYELKVSIEPPMGGKVNGAGKYTEGKEVQVDVTAFTGWEFVKWSGELSHSKPNFSITLNKNVNMTAHFKKATKLIDWLTVLRGIILLLPITAFLYSIPYFTRAKLSQTEITIGTLWKPEATQDLADFLEANTVPSNYFDFFTRKKIRVRINGDSTLAYKEAESRMQSKQWDIAFTNSPILSVSAKENSYKYVAGMFPRSNSYQSGLFVRTDSSIRSLRDIQASTRVGLGSFSSASSFYMPVYDLFGKSITANVGNRGGAIINLVKEGKVEIGSAAIGDSIRGDDPTIRIIHVSRDIPGAGVYASPNLSTSDYEQIRQLMLNAPQDIKDKANYGDKPEPDYTEFQKITQRVEEILVCADFSKNPVFLGCNTNVLTLEGVINSASVNGNGFIFNFSASNKFYNINVDGEIVKKVFGSDKLTDVQGLSVMVKVQEVGANNSIVITQPTQLRVIKKL